ncbi:hypothetical protein [Rhizobium leguminosarum]|uniref:hypothetical protein n=1 Tax=Rhizobium leguminosarum TaxID=384 RepID=UPI0013B9969D|nr:hypothetical protein [Rhizobium leguminosarum]NEI60893.1 hypothetical protein [Rhizobium leguminosarum]
MRRFQQVPDWSPGYINVCPHHMDIMIECTACGAMRTFDRNILPNELKHALIVEIEKRLRCSCGVKAAKLRFGHFVDDQKASFEAPGPTDD